MSATATFDKDQINITVIIPREQIIDAVFDELKTILENNPNLVKFLNTHPDERKEFFENIFSNIDNEITKLNTV